jgi:hypothetical protein
MLAGTVNNLPRRFWIDDRATGSITKSTISATSTAVRSPEKRCEYNAHLLALEIRQTNPCTRESRIDTGCSRIDSSPFQTAERQKQA